MRKITSLSGKVKKVPSTQADPNRYEFLNLNNAEPDLGVAAGNNYVLTSDTVGNRTWTNQVDIITNNVDQAYVNALNVNADQLDSQEGTYYLDFTNFTNLPDPTISVDLTGDVTGSGSVTLTDLTSGNVSITTTVADDSHNHSVSTITDFDSAVNTAISSTVDKAFVDALNVNADTLDNQEGTYYLDFTNFTNIPDPKIDVILSGDVTGSANATLTDLGNGVINITATVADDSHNHTIANIDGLQEALDAGGIDANTVISLLLTVDGSGSGLDADLLDGQEGTYYLDFTNFTNIPDPNIEVTLTGDVTGSANTTLTDLGNGTISITATVADDSHNHTIANIDGLQTALDGKADETITITAGSGLTGGGNLTANRTISHADTSSQANTNNTNGSVVQNVEIDTYGHVTSLSSVNLDTRYVNTSGDTMTGFLTLHADPTNALHAATKEYVDTIAAASLHYHDPVRVEAPSELTASYNNGTSGVGATLTGGNEVLVIDGVTVALNDRVLVYEQTNTAHNGVYSVTQLGVSGTTPWILTRTTDTDSYGASDPDALGQGDAFFVLEGDTGAGELYVMTTEGTITFGSTGITFSQIGASQVYSAGSGLELNDTVFSHSDTSSQADVGPLTGGNVVSEIDLDGFGHVTSLSTRTLTLGDLGFTGDPNSDNYIGWNLLVDNVEKDQVTADENVNFVGGSNMTLTYSAANNTITFEGTNTLANDATITLSAGGGLSGGGNFTTDQSVNETITFSHADTSSQASVDNSGGTVIQDVTLDTYGHVTALTSKTLTTSDISEGTNEYYTVLKANNAIDARVDKTFVDALNVNADTLDSQEGTYYLDFTNFTNIPDPTITLTGAVTGSGTMTNLGSVSITTTATADPTLTIDGDASGSATFTNLGNATLTLTIADDSHNHTIANIDGLQTALDGKADETITISAGDGLTGGGSLEANRTISHADTSSQASVNNSNGTVIQDVTLDTYGHVTGLASVDLDGRYYTETEADNRFVNVTGDTMTGNLNFGDNIKAVFGNSSDLQILHDGNNSYITDIGTGSLWLKTNGPNISLLDGSNNYMIRAETSSSVDLYHNTAKKFSTTSTGIDVTGTITSDGLTVDGTAQATQLRLASTGVFDDATATTSATTQVAIDQWSATTYGGAKVIIEAKDGVNRHITELLVTHDGTTAIATEYGTIHTSSSLATYEVDISSGNVRILATPASTNSTSFKVMRTTMFA